MYDWLELARLDFGMRCGDRGVANVIAWADAEILRLATPPDELFDLSLAGSMPVDEMLRRIAPILERAPSEVLARARAEWAERALGRLAADAAAGPDIAETIYRLADSDYFPSSEFNEVYWINEAFTDLGTGYRVFGIQLTRNRAAEFLRGFLERVRDSAPLVRSGAS